MSALNIQPPRVAFVDPDTGMITREWYRFIADLFTRVGGPNTINLDALITLFNALAVQVNGDEQAPPPAPVVAADDMTPPTMTDLSILDDLRQSPLPALIESIEFLQTEVRSLAEQLAAALNDINALKQGVTS